MFTEVLSHVSSHVNIILVRIPKWCHSLHTESQSKWYQWLVPFWLTLDLFLITLIHESDKKIPILTVQTIHFYIYHHQTIHFFNYNHRKIITCVPTTNKQQTKCCHSYTYTYNKIWDTEILYDTYRILRSNNRNDNNIVIVIILN